MTNYVPVPFKQVAAATLPTEPRVEVLPLQQPRVGMKIRRPKLVHADEKLRQGREIVLFGGSEGSSHCRSLVGEMSLGRVPIGGVLDLSRPTARWSDW